MKILIVDDDQHSRDALADVVTFMGHQAVVCKNAQEAQRRMNDTTYAIVISDIRMPGMDGVNFLRWIKSEERGQAIDVIMVTGHGDKNTAIDSLREGACDYLDKPVNPRELVMIIEKTIERKKVTDVNRTLTESFDSVLDERTSALRQEMEQTRNRLLQVQGIGTVVSASASMREILEQTEVFHDDPSVPVLIEGETGTGKEVIARLIHHGIEADDAPFIDINCSAISGELFECELFGHAPGAFTGARQGGSTGRIYAAAEGTLFLDEIGEMPLLMQPKLLRVLQQRSYCRVGSSKQEKCRARIIAATNCNLAEMVEAGSFRRDLYHRLNLGHIRIPPLRERTPDIQVLAEHFLEQSSRKRRKQFEGIAASAMDVLKSYRWPGNVRELEHCIERIVLINDDVGIRPRHLDFLFDDALVENASAEVDLGDEDDNLVITPLKVHLPEQNLVLHEIVTRLAQASLQRFDGNKTQAAAYLGLTRNALNRRLQGGGE